MTDKVRLLNDPILRQNTALVASFDATLVDLLSRMEATMNAERGVGLAANQIGIDQRVFVLRAIGNGTTREFINPEIIEQDDIVSFEGEGCLSIPGITATTERYKKIKLKFQDRHGNSQEQEFAELDAYAVQHEMDHLNGKLYIDQFGPVKKDLLVNKHKKFIRLKERQR